MSLQISCARRTSRTKSNIGCILISLAKCKRSASFRACHFECNEKSTGSDLSPPSSRDSGSATAEFTDSISTNLLLTAQVKLTFLPFGRLVQRLIVTQGISDGTRLVAKSK